MDKRKDNGGKREGAGRKSKADEEKVNEIFITALKEIYEKDTPNEAKIAFVKELAESQRGQIFIAEHLFGKPKEIVHTTHTLDNFNIKDVLDFDKTK